VWTDKRFNGVRVSEYSHYLTEALRIDPDALAMLDISRLQAIGCRYNSAKIDNLGQFTHRLRSSSHA